MSLGRLALDLDGEDAEQDDLHRGARCIPAATVMNQEAETFAILCIVGHRGKGQAGPAADGARRRTRPESFVSTLKQREVGDAPEGPRHAVLPGDVGGLQQRGGPSPVRHDVDGDEAGLDSAPGAVELLGGGAGAAKPAAQAHFRGSGRID